MHLIYKGPKNRKIRVYLTTENNIPIVKVVEPEGYVWPALGPKDILPNGKTVADIVATLINEGQPPRGYFGSCPRSINSKTTRAAAKAFLSQWPEGPQIKE